MAARQTTPPTGSDQRHPTVDDLSNHLVVTLAVGICGGASLPVDTEDVAVCANSLAPGRFTWRKFPDQISLEHIRVFLSDAKKEKNGALLSGSGDEGWMLTPAGSRFFDSHQRATEVPGTTRIRLSADERRWRSRERTRLIGTRAAVEYMRGNRDDLTVRDAEQFFRVDAYVTGTSRQRKIDRILILLDDDAELGPIARYLAEMLSSGGSDE